MMATEDTEITQESTEQEDFTKDVSNNTQEVLTEGSEGVIYDTGQSDSDAEPEDELQERIDRVVQKRLSKQEKQFNRKLAQLQQERDEANAKLQQYGLPSSVNQMGHPDALTSVNQSGAVESGNLSAKDQLKQALLELEQEKHQAYAYQTQQIESQRLQEIHANYVAQLETAPERYPDFQKVILADGNDVPYDEVMIEAIKPSRDAVSVLYNAAKHHRGELNSIRKERSPLERAMQMRLLGEKILAEAGVKHSRAPSPINRDRGNFSGESRNLSSFEDMYADSEKRYRRS